ncbi:MAG: translation initiation factor IF-3, partial [Propionibacteriaceae bacterium]|nr:translation initiation factor IF-3 [Propionibacteriaceae bacterium]
APLLKKDKEDGVGNNAVRTIPSPARRISTQD